MRIVFRLVCLAYWAFLTALLLVSDPAALVGLERVPKFPWGNGDIGIHFTAFTTLALMVHVTRWPRRPGWIVTGLLVCYGLTTETLQVFVPHRSVELLDYTENVLGVAAGSGLYWLAAWLVRRCRVPPETTAPSESKAAAADARGE
jgi:VanZ family protein